MLSMNNNQEKIPMRRHRLPGVDSYDVTADELDHIEHEVSQVGLDFSFGSMTLTAFISFMITLLTVEIKSTNILTGFRAIAIATGILTFYFAMRKRRDRLSQ